MITPPQVVIVAFICSWLLNRHKSLLQEYLLGRKRGNNVMWGKRREGGSIKNFAVWRKSTDINTKDCQGLIQGAGLSLENKEDIRLVRLKRWSGGCTLDALWQVVPKKGSSVRERESARTGGGGTKYGQREFPLPLVRCECSVKVSFLHRVRGANL